MDKELDRTNKAIDLAFEDINPMDYQGVIERQREINKELKTALDSIEQKNRGEK